MAVPKGSGPPEIPAWVDMSGSEPEIVLKEGVPYVPFLFRPASDEGKAYWDHGYLVQGDQGVWIVKEDRAVREFGVF